VEVTYEFVQCFAKVVQLGHLADAEMLLLVAQCARSHSWADHDGAVLASHIHHRVGDLWIHIFLLPPVSDRRTQCSYDR
jgi:hypothetical protein